MSSQTEAPKAETPPSKPPQTKILLRGKGLTACPAVPPECVHLDLSNNEISDFKTLTGAQKLKKLILDKNQLKNLELLPKIPSLETLWLNNNRLTSLAGTIIVLQKQAPNLKFLSLMRNPLCPEMYFQDGSLDSAYERYRLMIIAKFPKLKGLDATPVSSSERKQAAQMGETLEIKQPKKHTMSTGSETDFVKKADFSPPKKPAAFLAKGHMRYNGNYSEGNRFILNTDL